MEQRRKRMARIKASGRMGLVNRTANLLNNKKFSDIQFLVVSQGGKDETFYAHKLILAMAGRYFEEKFYRTKAPLQALRIRDSNPHAVFLMLQYIYCDELNLSTFDEAAQVMKLAYKYGIKDLGPLCKDRVQMENLTYQNLITKYECALLYPDAFKDLLYKCRLMICSETKAVFAMEGFKSTSINVIQDILRRDRLNIDSELELLLEVFKWSKEECKRRGFPTHDGPLRDVIDPLLADMRILSLSTEDFWTFVKEYNIFTTEESATLTCLILKQGDSVALPPYFCPLRQPRGRFTSANIRQNDNTRTDEGIYFRQNSDPTGVNNNRNHQQFGPARSAPVRNARQPTDNHFSYNSQSIPTMKTVPFKFTPQNVGSHSMNALNDTSKSKTPMPAPIMKVMPQKYSQNQNMQPQFDYLQKKNMCYDFNLEKMENNDLSFAGKTDIKCNTVIKMETGSIIVHSVELKVLNLKPNSVESETVILGVTNDSGTIYNCDVNKTFDLVNNTMLVDLPQPCKVLPGDPIDIEVTIEDIKPNRCYGSSLKMLELHTGLNVNASFSLQSNITTKSGSFFYLISRIIYSVAN